MNTILPPASSPTSAASAAPDLKAVAADQPGPQHDLARLAEARGDWAAAEQCWRRFLALDAGVWWAHSGLANALARQGREAEAEAVIEAAQARLPDQLPVFADHARLAESRGDWAAAERRWRHYLALDADSWWAHSGLVNALARQDRAGDAEAALEAAQARLPNELPLFADHARLAESRGDWEAALSRWGKVRQRFPGEWLGYAGCIAALRELGRADEADTVLHEGAARFPDQSGPQRELARVAEARGEWTEAEQRWRSFLSFDPNPWWAHTGLANALAQQGRAAEAESVLLAAQERLPQDGALFVDFAEIASREQQWPEAARRWATVRARWPEVRAYLGEGLALAETGRFDEADKVIEEAMKRFPSQHDPVAVYAEIAVRRKDWQTAVLRWTHARMLFPELEGFGHRLFEARLHLYDADPTDDRAQDEEVPAMPEDRRAMYDLMMSFESLGNGCEFGTVQRTYGAEPMGLLRWAAIGPQELVAALDSDFAGTGTLEQTNLWVHRKEYIVGDKKFNMGMHTFINEDTISHEKMLEQSCRRLKFLSKKLLEDIKSAEKIFVYLHPHLEASEVSALFKALRRHGKAWLLAVQVDAGTAAKVELVEPRLMRGYVPTAGLQPGEGAYKIPIESWAVICRAAFEHAKRELVGCAGTPGSI